MSLTYTFAASIVRLLGVKKMFRKSKDGMLDYAKGENAKSERVIGRAIRRARRRSYTLIERDVQGFRLLCYQNDEKPAEGAVLYLFGGGMITGPSGLDFRLVERILKKTAKDVWFLLYPLCSEGEHVGRTYAVCFEAYRQMTEVYAPERIGVLGFSSGACLALGIFLHNNALGRPLSMPGRIIAVSPGGVPDMDRQENRRLWEAVRAMNDQDIMIDAAYLKMARAILKGDEDLPEYMLDGTVGDFTAFPMTYLYYGGNECLYPFAKLFVEALKRDRVPHKLIVGEGMCHCYPMVRFFREGREAQDAIIDLLGA